MVHYRRNFIPGGTFFFTVTLDDRRSSALIDHVALLRAAFRKARSERPFVTDAIVILPDLLHAILTLPPGDSDFSDRWRRIKKLHAKRHCFGRCNFAGSSWRIFSLAEALLGTHHTG
jgi:REP element-mobilizing transposase RayT